MSTKSELVQEITGQENLTDSRRELFAEFQKGVSLPFHSHPISYLDNQRFASMKLRSFISARFNKDECNLRTELLQEIQRYPYVETTLNDMPIFSDKSLNDSVKESVMRALKDQPNEHERNRKLKEKEGYENHSTSPRHSEPSNYKQEEDVMDESADYNREAKGEEEDAKHTGKRKNSARRNSQKSPDLLFPPPGNEIIIL
ncbi:hypothetical protein EV368DRAFT_78007 [Lentinula lateritia]|nr:hypothetical protein EV368DRAFT_78007 [Lentinula lateritia]